MLGGGGMKKGVRKRRKLHKNGVKCLTVASFCGINPKTMILYLHKIYPCLNDKFNLFLKTIKHAKVFLRETCAPNV